MRQRILYDPVEFMLESAIVFDPPLTFLRHLFADRSGGPLPRNETSPAMVGAVEF